MSQFSDIELSIGIGRKSSLRKSPRRRKKASTSHGNNNNNRFPSHATPLHHHLATFLSQIDSFLPPQYSFTTLSLLSFTCKFHFQQIQQFLLLRRRDIRKWLTRHLGMEFICLEPGEYWLCGEEEEEILASPSRTHDDLSTKESQEFLSLLAELASQRDPGTTTSTNSSSTNTGRIPMHESDHFNHLALFETVRKTPRMRLVLPHRVFISKCLVTHKQWKKLRKISSRNNAPTQASRNPFKLSAPLPIDAHDEHLSSCNLIAPLDLNVEKDFISREDEPLEVTYQKAAELALQMHASIPSWSLWEIAASNSKRHVSRFPWGDEISKHFEFHSLVQDVHYGYEEQKKISLDNLSDDDFEYSQWKKGKVLRLKEEPTVGLQSQTGMQDLFRFGKEFNSLEGSQINHQLCVLRSLTNLRQSTVVPQKRTLGSETLTPRALGNHNRVTSTASPANIVENWNTMARSEHRAYVTNCEEDPHSESYDSLSNPLSLKHFLVSANSSKMRAGFRLMFVDGPGAQPPSLPMRQCPGCHQLSFQEGFCDTCQRTHSGETTNQVYSLLGAPLYAVIEQFGQPSQVKQQSSLHSNKGSSFLLYLDRGIYIKSTQEHHVSQQRVQSISFLPKGTSRWNSEFSQSYSQRVCGVSLDMTRGQLLDNHDLDVKPPTAFQGVCFEKSFRIPMADLQLHMKVVFHKNKDEIKSITLTNEGSTSTKNHSGSSDTLTTGSPSGITPYNRGVTPVIPSLNQGKQSGLTISSVSGSDVDIGFDLSPKSGRKSSRSRSRRKRSKSTMAAPQTVGTPQRENKEAVHYYTPPPAKASPRIEYSGAAYSFGTRANSLNDGKNRSKRKRSRSLFKKKPPPLKESSSARSALHDESGDMKNHSFFGNQGHVSAQRALIKTTITPSSPTSPLNLTIKTDGFRKNSNSKRLHSIDPGDFAMEANEEITISTSGVGVRHRKRSGSLFAESTRRPNQPAGSNSMQGNDSEHAAISPVSPLSGRVLRRIEGGRGSPESSGASSTHQYGSRQHAEKNRLQHNNSLGVHGAGGGSSPYSLPLLTPPSPRGQDRNGSLNGSVSGASTTDSEDENDLGRYSIQLPTLNQPKRHTFS